MRTLKSVLLFSTLAATCAATPVQAADIIIGAGSRAGEYTNTLVPAISAALSAQGNYSASAATTAGSQENLDQIMSGELIAGLTQIDVLALNQAEPDSDRLQLIGNIAPEALLCAARKGGKVRSYHNLTDQHEQPLVVSAGDPDSGSARTLQFLIANDPDLDDSKIKLVFEANTEAELDRLAAGNRDLVCFVMMPNPDSELIKTVADEDELEFIDFNSDTALAIEANGAPVYERMEVPVSPGVWGFRAKKVDTLITWVGLVVAKDADPAIIEALTQALATPDLLPPTTVAGKAKGLFTAFKDKSKELASDAKEMAGKAKQKAGELSEKAMQKAGELSETVKKKISSDE